MKPSRRLYICALLIVDNAPESDLQNKTKKNRVQSRRKPERVSNVVLLTGDNRPTRLESVRVGKSRLKISLTPLNIHLIFGKIKITLMKAK